MTGGGTEVLATSTRFAAVALKFIRLSIRSNADAGEFVPDVTAGLGGITCQPLVKAFNMDGASFVHEASLERRFWSWAEARKSVSGKNELA
jgi:hypothetical protein